MEENAAALHTAMNSVQALGRGFDVNCDTRLLYCKGVAGSRIVEIDEEHTRDLYLTDNLVIPNVSRDIKNSQDSRGRDGFGVCSYNEVSVGRKPVTGMQLCLEGIKQNRLSIHLQHLASLPKILQPYWDMHIAIGAPKWQGPEEQDSRWFEPVKWKKFSHVSTEPIENSETFIGGAISGVYIVTGAQLGVWDFGSRNVLHMKLLYSRLPGCTIRRSLWDHVSSDKSRKQFSSGSNSDDSSSSSRENNVGNKLMKFVDTSEMSKGPKDPPGQWLVTGGKLSVEKGKIVVRVKYSLLNY
ncbi:Hypothetical predicted protein [Olea europaea subsp. europaea]|uniref:MACPF domain-containing protein CAD1 n=1 Tax=Olea europaea subsp. europaea TaxID=158383 RepID=A0A8S0R6T7_OLEEU|nr:Hypothetical predicted protein [Olea europaea subsp. europaea]